MSVACRGAASGGEGAGSPQTKARLLEERGCSRRVWALPNSSWSPGKTIPRCPCGQRAAAGSSRSTGHPAGAAAGTGRFGSGLLEGAGTRSGNFLLGFAGAGRAREMGRATLGSCHRSPRAVPPCPRPGCASRASPEHRGVPGGHCGMLRAALCAIPAARGRHRGPRDRGGHSQPLSLRNCSGSGGMRPPGSSGSLRATGAGTSVRQRGSTAVLG